MDPVSNRDDVDSFFARCGLPASMRSRCLAFTKNLFPGTSIEEAKPQGYCSYTLSVGQDQIVQFRPPVHTIDTKLADAAKDVYGDLAPLSRELGVLEAPPEPHKHAADMINGDFRPADEAIAMGDERGCQSPLHVFAMTRIRGRSLAELRQSPENRLLAPPQLRRQRESVIGQFAAFIASGWKHGLPESDPAVSSLRGRVGGSIRWRLEQMSAHLPQRFRPAARIALERLKEMTSLRWALTHGDLIPANVMVEQAHEAPEELVLTGLLDWAEAEYLPFGVGIYGLEELLGETDENGCFVYYPDVKDLRRFFWSQLEAELSCSATWRQSYSIESVEMSHLTGVLLWHGIAFDNGNLNRVVEPGRDDEEIRRLDLFFACQTAAGEVDQTHNDVPRTTPNDRSHLQHPDGRHHPVNQWAHINHLSLGEIILGRT